MILTMPERSSWASAIGLLIINFGVLDLLVQDYLEDNLSPEEFSKIRERPFYVRFDRVKEWVGVADYSLKQKQSFEKLCMRLEPIRELRNHVAHGILRIGLAQDQKTWILTLSLSRDLDGSNTPDAMHLDFQELTKALGELAVLIEDFQKFTGGWSDAKEL